MELKKALDIALDGNAILFVGAGFSVGATNIIGEGLPNGTKLRDIIGKESGLEESCYRKYDLSDVAEYYVGDDEHKVRNLIVLLKNLFTVRKVEPYHDTILSVPWKRIYTTNYDDAIENAGKNNGKKIQSITLSDGRNDAMKSDVCVHLNGFIDNLSKLTIWNEFKLINASYNADTLVGNPWFDSMVQDFMSARAIIVIGYSMSYDLDITRVLALPKVASKIIFINKELSDPIARRKFTQYATVEEIGIEGFADKVVAEKKIFTPSPWQKRGEFNCFDYMHMEPFQPQAIAYENYINFYFLGQFFPSFLHKSAADEYDTVINRSCVNTFFMNWHTSKIFLVTSGLGNGKTIFCEILKNELRTRDCHVFSFSQYSEDNLAQEVEEICQSYKKAVVIIDDCYQHLDVLRLFQIYGKDSIIFVLTTRIALAGITHRRVARIFEVKEDAIFRLSLQEMNRNECNQLAHIFVSNKLLPSNLSMKTEDEVSGYFFNDCDASLAAILLNLFKSTHIKSKLDELFSDVLSSEKKALKSLIIAGLSNSVWNLGLDVDDILNLLRVNPLTYQSNPIFIEFFNVNKLHFMVHSPIIAEFMIYNVVPAQCLREVLVDLVREMSISYRVVPRYGESLKAVMSHANFLKIVQQNNGAYEIKKFYDSLRNEEFFANNPFYWEEFAAACLDAKDFPTAKQCIENAYRCGKLLDGFIPFQIATVEADYWLGLSLEHDAIIPSISENIANAKELLIKYYNHPQNNHSYVFSVSRKFVKIFEMHKHEFNRRDLSIYIQCISEIRNKLNAYMKGVECIYDRGLEEFMQQITRSVSEAKLLSNANNQSKTEETVQKKKHGRSH